MKLLSISLILIFALTFPSLLGADQNLKNIYGAYQSLGDSNRVLTVHLKPDNTAVIDILKITRGLHEYYEKEEERHYATWSFDGSNIKITYNRMTEVLRFHESLSFEAFGIEGGVAGLKVPLNLQNSGILSAASLWKSEELIKLSKIAKFRFRLKGVRLFDSDSDIPILFVLTPGLLIFLAGIFLAFKRLIFLRSACHASGEVISLAASSSCRRHGIILDLVILIR